MEASASSTTTADEDLPTTLVTVRIIRDDLEDFCGNSNNESQIVEQDDDDRKLPPPSRAVHLILHMDINETILLGDQAGDDSRDDALHKMLAKSAFVQIPAPPATKDGLPDDDTKAMASACHNPRGSTEDIVPTHWWNGERIETDSMVAGLLSETATVDGPRSIHNPLPPPLYTKWEWPANCCPYYRTSFKPHAKAFAHHPHGRIYQGVHDLLVETLTPSNKLARKLAQHQVPSNMANILPAFWETLQELTRRRRQRDDPSDFTLVLRTMGTDLMDMSKALMTFATGQHPDYPDVYDTDLILSSSRLYQGRWTTQRTTSAVDSQVDEGDAIYQLWQDDRLVAADDSEVLDLIHSTTRVCGIQDDYASWKEHHFEPRHGKPVWMMLPPPQDDQVNYHHLLFDDNIHNVVNEGIASVRRRQQVPMSDDDDITDDDYTTMPASPWKALSHHEILEQHNHHLIRVPTIEPMLNRRWFLEQIDAVLRRVRAVDK